MLGIRCCAAVRGIVVFLSLQAFHSTFNSQPTCSVFQQFHLLFVCYSAVWPLMFLKKVKRAWARSAEACFILPHSHMLWCMAVRSLRRGPLHSGALLPYFELPWQQLGRCVFVCIWFWVAAWKRCLTPARWRRCSPRRRTERVQKLLLCVFHVCWSCVNTLPQGCTWKRVLLLSTLFIAVCEFVHVNSCLLYLLAFFFFLGRWQEGVWFHVVSRVGG